MEEIPKQIFPFEKKRHYLIIPLFFLSGFTGNCGNESFHAMFVKYGSSIIQKISLAQIVYKK